MSDAMRSQDVFGRINKISHIIKLQTYKYKVNITKYPPHDQQWRIQFSPWPKPEHNFLHDQHHHPYTVVTSQWPNIVSGSKYNAEMRSFVFNEQKSVIAFSASIFHLAIFEMGIFFSLPSSLLNSLLSAKTG